MAALTYLLWLTTREGLRPETAAALVRRFGTAEAAYFADPATLRERKEDLPLLVDNFIHRLNYQLGMVIEGVAPGAMDLLMDYDWPGNVRELQNAVESAMNAADSPILRRRDFRQLEQRMQARRRRQLTGPGDFKLRPARQAFERELIRDALAAAGGNRVKAAALLDISRTVLYEKMEQYQLK